MDIHIDTRHTEIHTVTATWTSTPHRYIYIHIDTYTDTYTYTWTHAMYIMYENYYVFIDIIYEVIMYVCTSYMK